jgi:hypothetical protein
MKRLFTFLAVVLAAGCSEAAQPLGPENLTPMFAKSSGLGNQSTSDAYSVAANVGSWQATGFTLKAGLPIVVTATGVASCGSSPCTGGPAGVCPWWIPDCVAPAGLLVPGGKPFALYAQVGSGPPVFVGNGPTTLTGSGLLSFGYNDRLGTYGDNGGGFDVTVTYPCQPGNGNGDANHYHCSAPGR